VLAYLAEPSAGALPGPAVHDDHLEVHP
jgi:hypothetical protein